MCRTRRALGARPPAGRPATRPSAATGLGNPALSPRSFRVAPQPLDTNGHGRAQPDGQEVPATLDRNPRSALQPTPHAKKTTNRPVQPALDPPPEGPSGTPALPAGTQLPQADGAGDERPCSANPGRIA